MRQNYNKLVRNYIPELIRQSGNSCEITVYSPSEYLQALRDKIVEEAQEVAKAKDDDLVQELADLYEVIDALLEVYNIKKETVLTQQHQQRQTRGSFSQKIQLVWTETSDQNNTLC